MREPQRKSERENLGQKILINIAHIDSETRRKNYNVYYAIDLIEYIGEVTRGIVECNTLKIGHVEISVVGKYHDVLYFKFLSTYMGVKI